MGVFCLGNKFPVCCSGPHADYDIRGLRAVVIPPLLTNELSITAGLPSEGDAGHITVVLGRFGALMGRGLAQILREDQGLRIVGIDLDKVALEHTVARQAPQVAILDELSVVPAKSSFLERLRSTHPATGIVVLAHRPPLAYGMRLLAVGPVACDA
jgi:hypothetical protein